MLRLPSFYSGPAEGAIGSRRSGVAGLHVRMVLLALQIVSVRAVAHATVANVQSEIMPLATALVGAI